MKLKVKLYCVIVNITVCAVLDCFNLLALLCECEDIAVLCEDTAVVM